MDYIFNVGLIGGITLVLGAAWKEGSDTQHPMQSMKNWLFAIGGLIMLIYAFLGYQEGGSIFFVILEILAVISSVLMMLNTSDTIDAVVLTISSIGLIIWSVYLFEDYKTIIFILGFFGIGLGYAFETGTTRREFSLAIGGILIAVFSFIGGSWIFFWLNVFFALFSGYYLMKGMNTAAIQQQAEYFSEE